jgi:hypothetical protein
MGEKKNVTIIVNGIPHETPKDDISYVEIVTMAFPEYGTYPERTYSITYQRGQGNKPEGALLPGENAKVKEGMIFTVLDTSGTEDNNTGEEKKNVTIIVNGTPHEVPEGNITYAEVVTIAFPEYEKHPERTYSVTYRRGHGDKPEGILSTGGSVKVKEGMTFSVSETSQS